MAAQPLLFTPAELRGVKIRNRIVISPMCTYSAKNGFVDDWHLVHLGKLAQGGAGLILTEAAGVEEHGSITHGGGRREFGPAGTVGPPRIGLGRPDRGPDGVVEKRASDRSEIVEQETCPRHWRLRRRTVAGLNRSSNGQPGSGRGRRCRSALRSPTSRHHRRQPATMARRHRLTSVGASPVGVSSRIW